MKRLVLLLLYAPLAAFAADPSTNPDAKPKPLDPANMDTSVQPGDDFYQFANGGWMKTNPIPPEFSRWGSFEELGEKNIAAAHEVAEKVIKGGAKGSDADTQKVAD